MMLKGAVGFTLLTLGAVADLGFKPWIPLPAIPECNIMMSSSTRSGVLVPSGLQAWKELSEDGTASGYVFERHDFAGRETYFKYTKGSQYNEFRYYVNATWNRVQSCIIDNGVPYHLDSQNPSKKDTIFQLIKGDPDCFPFAGGFGGSVSGGEWSKKITGYADFWSCYKFVKSKNLPPDTAVHYNSKTANCYYMPTAHKDDSKKGDATQDGRTCILKGPTFPGSPKERIAIGEAGDLDGCKAKAETKFGATYALFKDGKCFYSRESYIEYLPNDGSTSLGWTHERVHAKAFEEKEEKKFACALSQ